MPNEVTIKSGDSLSAIAARNNTTVEALQKANGITNPDSIKSGQRIIIPFGTPEGYRPVNEQTYEEKKLYNTTNELMALYEKFGSAKDAKEKAAILKEIKVLENKAELQNKTAKTELGPKDDYVLIIPKKDTPLSELKEVFDIGSVSKSKNKLSYEYKNYPEGSGPAEEGRQYKDWTNNTIHKGDTLYVQPSQINYQGAFTELKNWLIN